MRREIKMVIEIVERRFREFMYVYYDEELVLLQKIFDDSS